MSWLMQGLFIWRKAIYFRIMERLHWKFIAYFITIIGNYNFIADTQRDRYIFYVNESIQICMMSGESFPVKVDFNHTWRHDQNLL